MGESLAFVDITLNTETQGVYRNGVELNLGPTNFRLLASMMEKPGRVWTWDRHGIGLGQVVMKENIDDHRYACPI